MVKPFSMSSRLRSVNYDVASNNSVVKNIASIITVPSPNLDLTAFSVTLREAALIAFRFTEEDSF